MYCADCDIDELTQRILAGLIEASDGEDAGEVIREVLLWSSEEEDRCDL